MFQGRRLENQMPNPIQQHHGRDQHARQLEYSHFIPALRHAREPLRAAL